VAPCRQHKDKRGRHGCNRSGDGGTYGYVMCAERSGREQGIGKASGEYAPARK